MRSPNAFDSVIGRLVKVIYKDSGGETKIKKGHLIAADAEFIQLETWEHTYMIRRTAISELRTVEAGP